MGNQNGDVEVQGGGDQQPEASGEAPKAEAGSELDVLRGQLEEEKARAEKCLSNWQRAEADLANFKRRVEQERSELVKSANSSLILKLLPVLDDFDRAIEAVPEDARSQGWVEGIRLIDRKLCQVLEQEGVTPIDALGKEFDPHVHEAVLREEGEGDVDVVVEELQKGYKLHDRVLRPTMVKVGRRKSTTHENDKKE
ncbi:MAG: nucleotide exchange factor GrpE [Sphingomonadaceae bacterium]